jgi:hypothetical protein|tara:strand:- start:385 stop:555 length:171 start_codon:yes stop_codon:yes gene_type:complete
MTELTTEHFELHDRNKDTMLQRNKLKYLEDRIVTLEKSLGAIHKILGKYQMTEGDE